MILTTTAVFHMAQDDVAPLAPASTRDGVALDPDIRGTPGAMRPRLSLAQEVIGYRDNTARSNADALVDDSEHEMDLQTYVEDTVSIPVTVYQFNKLGIRGSCYGVPIW